LDNVSAAELAKALGHPMRIDIVRRIREAGELSPSEYGETSGETLNNSSYHTRVLKAAGVIEVARTEPRRGALESFYALTGPKAPAATALLDLLAEFQ
jgi:DNA-binding transcriptional ArsR family regulator